MGICTSNSFIYSARETSCIHFGSGSQSSIYCSCTILTENVQLLYTLEAISGVCSFFTSPFQNARDVGKTKTKEKKYPFSYALMKTSLIFNLKGKYLKKKHSGSVKKKVKSYKLTYIKLNTDREIWGFNKFHLLLFNQVCFNQQKVLLI